MTYKADSLVTILDWTMWVGSHMLRAQSESETACYLYMQRDIYAGFTLVHTGQSRRRGAVEGVAMPIQ